MKILKIDDETFKVFGDSLAIEDELEPGVYAIEFLPMQGFFLKKRAPLTVTEKLYGKHMEKIDKLIKAYDRFDRSMGVIFSGDKGIGKSIAARMLCQKMVKKGIPVIVVNDEYDGLTAFIDSIEQECVVLFDEFEKNFPIKRNNDDDENMRQQGQEKLLTLFDGTGSQEKRLYLITCNEVRHLSDLLVNRPGRFHYHIRWQYPTENEIREYLKDKLVPAYYDSQVQKVVNFGAKMKLNYDCLRAIAFELNMGIEFEDAIEDLNIKNVNLDDKMALVIKMKDGAIFKRTINVNLFDEECDAYLCNDKCEGSFTFRPDLLVFVNGKFIVDLKSAFFNIDGEDETKKIKTAYLIPSMSDIDRGFGLAV